MLTAADNPHAKLVNEAILIAARDVASIKIQRARSSRRD